MNIVDIIKAETCSYKHNLAVIDEKSMITYQELFTMVDVATAQLQSFGICPHERVALLCCNSPEYIVISLAILKLGAAMVPIPASLNRSEIQTIIDNISINALIYQAKLYSEKTSKPLHIKQLKFKRYAHEVCLPDEYFRIHPAFIRFSSGTTGRNKGVVISHKSIIERTDAAQAGLKMSPDDVIIWVLDMSYHFVVTILLFLRKAATIVISNKEFTLFLQDALTKFNGTFLYASPVHYNVMLQSEKIKPRHLSRVRLAVSTAMRQPIFESSRFCEKFGFELTEAFGIIEVGLPFINLSQKPSKRGSVGKILPDYQVTIDRPDEQGVGRIMLKGKGMFDAYFIPWQLRNDILDKGYFKTGDLGRVDADGFLFLTGREKNVINFSGFKIFPEEVEEVLNQHPEVRQSLVYSVPHETYGEFPVADIVAATRTKPDLNSIRRFCYSRLAASKVPKKLLIVKDLPRTASGKLLRR